MHFCHFFSATHLRKLYLLCQLFFPDVDKHPWAVDIRPVIGADVLDMVAILVVGRDGVRTVIVSVNYQLAWQTVECILLARGNAEGNAKGSALKNAVGSVNGSVSGSANGSA